MGIVKKRMLITAIGGDVGYGIIKALRQSHHDVYIIGCDIRKYNMSYNLVDEFYIAPSYNDEILWLDFIQRILEKSRVDFFWPVAESEIKLVNDNKMIFQEIALVINTSDILTVAMDKGKTAEVLAQEGLRTPKTWNALAECEKSYPLIVKEKFGCGSSSITIVESDQALKNVFHSLKEPIIQEYVGTADEEYTLSIFSDGNVINYITFKRELGYDGMSKFIELVDDEILCKITNDIVRILDVKGSINVQMRKINNTYCIFEINPRISSTIGFRCQLGFNDVEWWIDMLEGKDIAPYAIPKEKIFGVRSVEELIFYE